MPNIMLLSYGIGATAIRPLGQRSAITLLSGLGSPGWVHRAGFTGLDRLADEAGNSPLISERGWLTQFSVGLGYGLRFNL